VVQSLALSNLSVAFKFESNGRVLLELPSAPNLAARVASLWGDEVAARFLALSRTHDGITVAGLIERPDASLAGPRRVHLFVDNRPFRDRELVWAVERAYRTTVPHGARPSLLLYLDAPAGQVDVNVHPAKAEVRFRARPVVEAAIEAAVRSAHGGAESAATMDTSPRLPQLAAPASGPRTQDRRSGPAPGQLAFFVPAAHPLEDGEPGEPASEAAQTPPPRARLWQIHDTYLLAETRSGMLIIDQHSAHERVLFQEMMGAFADGGSASQRLLFPIVLRLSPAEYDIVDSSKTMFEQAGFEIEPFGGRTVIVHAAPNPHPWFDPERCLREMISELAEGSELTRAAHNQHERIAMTFACKAAIKAGQTLSAAEMEELFDRLFATELPHHDVHGRPTIVRLSLEELQRRFGRHG
jgi:DNA mismatch repair protein MutL